MSANEPSDQLFLGGRPLDVDAPDLPARFIELMAEALTTVNRYRRGELSGPEAARKLATLRALDDSGHEWTVGATTMGWYNRPVGTSQWQPASPPTTARPKALPGSLDTTDPFSLLDDEILSSLEQTPVLPLSPEQVSAVQGREVDDAQTMERLNRYLDPGPDAVESDSLFGLEQPPVESTPAFDGAGFVDTGFVGAALDGIDGDSVVLRDLDTEFDAWLSDEEAPGRPSHDTETASPETATPETASPETAGTEKADTWLTDDLPDDESLDAALRAISVPSAGGTGEESYDADSYDAGSYDAGSSTEEPKSRADTQGMPTHTENPDDSGSR